MNLNELAYNIRNLARGGQGNSDDEKLNIRQIKFWINAYRVKAIMQMTDYGKMIDPQLMQDLGAVPLEEVDAADSLCPPVEWGCTVKKVSLPKLVDLPNNRALMFVGKIDKRTHFVLDHADVTGYKEATQFGHLSSRAYMIGSNLYFQLAGLDKGIKYVNIRGVFENPEKVEKFATAGCTAACYDANTDEYPMSLSMYEIVTKSILTTELNMVMQTANEQSNDAKQDKGLGASPIARQ